MYSSAVIGGKRKKKYSDDFYLDTDEYNRVNERALQESGNASRITNCTKTCCNLDKDYY